MHRPPTHPSSTTSPSVRTPRILLCCLAALSWGALSLTGGCSSDSGETTVTECPRGEVFFRGECVPRNTRDATSDDDGEERDDDIADPPDTIGSDPDGEEGQACETGATACNASGVPMRCVAGRWETSTPCASGQICVSGQCVRDGACEPGEVLGCANERTQLVCGPDGRRFENRGCDASLWCLEGICSERRCFAGERRCRDEFVAEVCDADETSFSFAESCSDRPEGEEAICVDGECQTGCAFFDKQPTYIGCEYWAADLPDFDDPGNRNLDKRAAVVVANQSPRRATVLLSTEDPTIILPQTVFTVEPGEVEVIRLPNARNTETGRTYRSFRLLMSEPMVAYQFKPFDTARAASNDATILLPTNALGTEYYVLSWPGGVQTPIVPQDAQRGWFSVMATHPGETEVTITFADDVINSRDFGNVLRQGTTHTFFMYPGEVLTFEAESEFRIPPRNRDLTGSRVVSSQPVAVFGGHKQAVIGPIGGESGCCADRLEHQMYPVAAWGREYRALKSPSRGGEVDRFRVLASEDNTVIETEPPIQGLNGARINAGQFVEGQSASSFIIRANNPILVGQYLLSQQSEGVTRTTGDPTFLLAVPREQYRRSYLFAVPPNFRENHFVVVKPAGVTVRHNGTPLPESAFSPLASSGDVVGTFSVQAGAHRLESAETFGVQIYGYAAAVSYGYPGGLDLRGLR